MANYIKIKAVDVNHPSQLSDILIGGVTSVFQGLANGTGDASNGLFILNQVKVIYLLQLEKLKSGQTNLYQLQQQIQEDL